MAIAHIVLILILSVSTVLVQPSGIPSSIAIVMGGRTATVCAIVKKDANSIECSRVSTLGSGKPFPIRPTISFLTLSGGYDSLCGLRLDGKAFFCWDHTMINSSSNGVLVYQNDTVPLRDLVVGESQVTASDRNGTFTQWWFAGQNFPAKFPGNFRSHTSGDNFTCAIDNDTDAVKCWGPRGLEIQAAFLDVTMSTIIADQFRACGVTMGGRILCSSISSKFRQPSFGFRSLALGSRHTCVLRSSDGAVVCWGVNGEEYAPAAKDLPFLFLVAKGDLFCGVTMAHYNVHCWWNDRSPAATVIKLPLEKIVPGICTMGSSCRCGSIGGPQKYCTNSGDDICGPCTSLPSHYSKLSKASIAWIVIACVVVASLPFIIYLCRNTALVPVVSIRFF